jgi:hypothetical protein
MTNKIKIIAGELLLFKILPFNKHGTGYNSSEVELTFSEPSAPLQSPMRGIFSNATHLHIFWTALMKD